MSKVQSLTPASIDALKVGKMSDARTPGLYVEVQGSGAKVWKYLRRVSRGTTLVKMTLGSYPAHTIADARDWAAPINLAVERGEDPREALKAKAAVEALTVEHCHSLYMTAIRSGTWKVLKPRTLKDKEYMFAAEIKPALGSKSIFDVTDDTLWELVEEKGEIAPVRANRLAAELKVFFGWCASRRGKKAGIDLPLDPARTLDGHHFNESKRKRNLSDEEITLFLRAVALEGRLYRRALLLLLLTGCRKSEVMGAPSSELIGDTWTIPGKRTKNKLAHVVPLGLWGKVLAQTNDSWMIQQSNARGRGGDGPMLSGWYRIRDRIHANMEKLAGKVIEQWTLHDLRRTMRSNTKPLGIDTDTAEAMVNHKKTGLNEIYDQYELLDEKREGFAKWEAKLASMARKANVAHKLDVPVTSRKAR